MSRLFERAQLQKDLEIIAVELDDFSLGSEAGFGADPLVVASKACRPNNLYVMKAILLGSLAMP